MLKLLPFVLALAACAGCPAPPAPSPVGIFDGGEPGDAGPADDCRAACENARALACGDVNGDCEAVCRHIEATHHQPMDLDCVSHAVAKETLRQCAGPWRCP